MLISSKLLQNMGGSCFISQLPLNKASPKGTEKDPYKVWKGRVPSYKYLWLWGCLAKIVIPQPKKVKIGLYFH